MGTREKAADIDFSDVLEEEVESQLKEAGERGGGTHPHTRDASSCARHCADQRVDSMFR